MQRRVGAFFLFALLAAPGPLAAAGLPAIKTTRSNAVPVCVTPGRLLAYLESRNPQLDPRFRSIASEYMRIGETLGVRWDYAFYQMLLETGSLSFRDGNRSGDVKPQQNNFAGLGATGRGERGESFKDIATGVRAHLEHLLLYAGERVDDPVADRTRKVQEWGVLTDWHKGFARPVTFGDLATKWAPGTRSYRRMIEGIAERFEEFCAGPDPKPELMQEAQARKDKRASESKAAEAQPERPVGSELAQRAIATGKAESDEKRLGLGIKAAGNPAAATSASVPVRMLNQPAAEMGKNTGPGTVSALDDGGGLRLERERLAGALAASAAKPSPQGKADKGSSGDRTLHTASTAAAAKAAVAPSAAGQKCRVWTASYGGQKAMIIKSQGDKIVNYTVLDVNEGSEAREAEAFISAYAKNGAIAGQFGSQAQALEKAFELCPEG
jgi:hypothetical protein